MLKAQTDTFHRQNTQVSGETILFCIHFLGARIFDLTVTSIDVIGPLFYELASQQITIGDRRISYTLYSTLLTIEFWNLWNFPQLIACKSNRPLFSNIH